MFVYKFYFSICNLAGNCEMINGSYENSRKIKLSSIFTKMVSASEPLLGSKSYGRRSSTMYNYPRSKRGKKGATWGAKERAGMSFLIVIAFFAVFALIILTEVSLYLHSNYTFYGKYLPFIGICY